MHLLSTERQKTCQPRILKPTISFKKNNKDEIWTFLVNRSSENPSPADFHEKKCSRNFFRQKENITWKLLFAMKKRMLEKDNM